MFKNIRNDAVRIALAFVLSLTHVLLCVLDVQAAKSVDVVITAQPSGMFAPTDFDAQTITDTKITVSWTPNIFAATTMVRGKIGSYPVDATDGYLIYNGAGNTVDDTAVSLDDTATNMFYRGWSVDGVGVTSLNYAQDNTGGIGMTLIALLGFALIMSWIALRNRSYWIMATFASATWGFDLALWTTGVIRPSTVTVGSPADQIFVIVMWGLIALFFVMPMFAEDSVGQTLKFRNPFQSPEENEERRARMRQPTRNERIAAYRTKANNAIRGIRD